LLCPLCFVWFCLVAVCLCAWCLFVFECFLVCVMV
jgi:hypothetical protein